MCVVCLIWSLQNRRISTNISFIVKLLLYIYHTLIHITPFLTKFYNKRHISTNSSILQRPYIVFYVFHIDARKDFSVTHS